MGLNTPCAFLVFAQSREQVNREEAVSLPTTEFLRCTGEQNLGKGQVGFFQFFVWPYFKELEKHIPELNAPTEQITVNKDRFKRVGDGKEQMAPVRTRKAVHCCVCLCLPPPSPWSPQSAPNLPLWVARQVSARDNEMMAWSKNVAVEALGADHAQIQQQQAVTVLMADDASEGEPRAADHAANRP
jgi:hypothetical protein